MDAGKGMRMEGKKEELRGEKRKSRTECMADPGEDMQRRRNDVSEEGK